MKECYHKLTSEVGPVWEIGYWSTDQEEDNDTSEEENPDNEEEEYYDEEDEDPSE